MLNNTKELKERNKQIIKAYEKGYSQHMIAIKYWVYHSLLFVGLLRGIRDELLLSPEHLFLIFLIFDAYFACSRVSSLLRLL